MPESAEMFFDSIKPSSIQDWDPDKSIRKQYRSENNKEVESTYELVTYQNICKKAHQRLNRSLMGFFTSG